MSLDTKDKRSSALLVGLGFGRVLPNPDGAWSQGDRQQVGLSYRGILAAAPTRLALQYLEYTAPPRLLDFTAKRRVLDYQTEVRLLDYAPRSR